MELKTVSLVGLGALGIMYGHHLTQQLPEGNLRILADEERAARYRQQNFYCNGALCRFDYITPQDHRPPADLLIFAVKFQGLADAVALAGGQVGPHTTVLSLLNGISSESILAQAYGAEKVLYCVAQGMDAVKIGTRMEYKRMGELCFGDEADGVVSPRTRELSRFFTRYGVAHQVDPHMKRRMWGKFMLNVGVNQTLAVFGGDYGTVQREGEERQVMLAAMREVMVLSQLEGVGLTQEELSYWLGVLSPLNLAGKPSMRQDVEAHRPTEVELFSGTVLSLADRHGIDCPVNRMLYDKIRAIEAEF